MNIFKLITDASIVVQAILLILLFFSVFSWTIIIFKRKTFRTATARSKKFLEIFKKSRSLTEVNEAAKSYPGSPAAALFLAGYKEIAYLAKQQQAASEPANGSRLENLSRALTKASNAEVARMEKMMGFLATTGSVSPFIGLFGTVWGIMDTFIGIGVTGSTSLVSVAPGIAEALIATAVGLFAAIPAVMAYNMFLHQLKDQITDMEDFSLELLSIAERLYGSP
ncbi:MAG: protein TolQ [Acidobacteriota bacterium]|jgi:biopolymer transport protein TolQ|nr:protein TolQ [Acidobacteriota bacterium]OQB57945.1 MAG: Biopolymer transport protein ExbB [Candidatus Aminicenantes bacterium ADurb.Bin147]HNQ79703.1 protein TolQ [Candidatus Aminicenantes bacterium]MDD8009847.1 protein TolQ [Acidobacteriota bacterium]MDD8029327.1 protein TolQ [Acidobacteriota bacterium]